MLPIGGQRPRTTIGDAVIGGTATRVLFIDSNGKVKDSSDLTIQAGASITAAQPIIITDTYLSRYAAKQLMISGDGTGATTNAGIILGYEGTNSGYSAMWSSTVTPGANNMALRLQNANTFLNAPTGGTTQLGVALSVKASVDGVAGHGLDVTGGTATTDVAALSVTRTNNNAAVATGVQFAFTDTTSAAGFLPFEVKGGASATTSLFSVGKAGIITAPNATLTAITTGTNADFLCLSSGGVVLLQTSACTISSLRFKEDVKQYRTGALDIVRKLNPITFRMKAADEPNADWNYDKAQIGLSAENVAEVVPLAAIYEQDGTTPKSYRQESIIAVLVKAVQEQDVRLSRLEARR